MKTLPAPAPKKTVRRGILRKPSSLPADWGLPSLTPLPPAKATAADLLRVVRAGEFLKGVDIAAVERACKSRASSRALRAKP